MTQPDAKDIPDRFYNTGVVASLEVVPDDFSVLLRGLYRAKVLGWERNVASDDEESYWMAKVGKFEDRREEFFIEKDKELVAHPDDRLSFRVVFSKLKKLLKRFVEAAGENDAGGIGAILDNFENYDLSKKFSMDQLIWALLSVIPEATASEKQAVLVSNSILERIGAVSGLLSENIAMLQMGSEFEDALKKRTVADKSQPGNSKDTGKGTLARKDDSFIRGVHPELIKRWKIFQEIRSSMNEDAQQGALDDFITLKSFKNPETNTHEWPKYMKHLDFNLNLPWNSESAQEKDMKKTKDILDEDHYALEVPKDNILDSLAPSLIGSANNGEIMCFVGGPGVGKTSLGESIARAMNRKFVRISVGGIRDEAQIRGHSFTYVGAEPGQILKKLKSCGTKNPVFMIDEIDKMGGMSVSGDPQSAMLEVLDSKQNKSFHDHYLDAGFDLSKVLFICTANVEHTIPGPLRDRMNIIRIPGYIEPEKIEIAIRHLIPRLMQEVNLAKQTDNGTENLVKVVWENGSISKIVQDYTSESGVRNLERTLKTILKKICRRYIESKKSDNIMTDFAVNDRTIFELLGPPKVFKNKARPTKAGETYGLAWTEHGGEIIKIEIIDYPRPADKKNTLHYRTSG